jgi:hypothetical protein
MGAIGRGRLLGREADDLAQQLLAVDLRALAALVEARDVALGEHPVAGRAAAVEAVLVLALDDHLVRRAC